MVDAVLPARSRWQVHPRMATRDADGKTRYGAQERETMDIQITGLKTFIVASNPNGGNWVFVKVYTNQDGLTGLGEGTVTSKAETIAAAIGEHERFLIGRDPRNIEWLWQAMYRYPRWRGGPVLNSAISAIEMALWDIKGKMLGVPVWQLLGGAARDRIRLYTHGSPHSDAGLDKLVKLVKSGYTAVKMGPFEVTDGVVDPRRDVRRGAAGIKRLREAVGDDVDILIDAHGLFTPVMAGAPASATRRSTLRDRLPTRTRCGSRNRANQRIWPPSRGLPNGHPCHSPPGNASSPNGVSMT